jgi:NAD(P)-dependent dehydrogenase (short-subunit alcohol dehydrogenase family)
MKPVLAVTGGAHGIGQGIAEHFAAAGYEISIADVEAPQSEPSGMLYVQTDVSDAKAVASWIDRTVERFGRLDVLINNAGIAHNVDFLAEHRSIHRFKRRDLVAHACHGDELGFIPHSRELHPSRVDRNARGTG